MGKRKRTAKSAAKSSLDDAFDIQSDLLESIKQKQHIPQPPDPKEPGQSQVVPQEEANTLEDGSASPETRFITAPSSPKREHMPLVTLKQVAPIPELVEWHDTHAPDPVFLATLKAHPGSVPVPATWQGREFRSKYAVSKPYKLPKNVYETGIVQQRNVFEEKSSGKLTAKERATPKLGTLDLDLDKLKAAFFKSQSKPRLYPFGQVYTEKLEQEQDFSECKPGVLSNRLRDALGLTGDQEPPWVSLMRKFGFPEAYGDLNSGTKPLAVKHWGELKN